MKIGAGVLVYFLLCSVCWAQTVYKCKTEQGVIYSQSPCADDAEKRTVSPPSPASDDRAVGSGGFRELSQDELFSIGGASEDILQRFGPPAARYRKGDEERWFYPNLGQIENGARLCAEIHISEGSSYQITWLPEAVMAKSVQAARRIGDWRPPTNPPRRNFFITGSDPRGLAKPAVVARYGEPDLKKVFNGVEIWEYQRIPMDASGAQNLTLYIEFEGNSVSQSMAN